MRLTKARVRGYRSVIDSGWFDVEHGKQYQLVLMKLVKLPFCKHYKNLILLREQNCLIRLEIICVQNYDEDIEKGGIDSSKFTVVEDIFS